MSGNDKKEIERREKIDKTKEEIGEIEDTTKYGEFVSSYFAWLTLDRQKKTMGIFEYMDAVVAEFFAAADDFIKTEKDKEDEL